MNVNFITKNVSVAKQHIQTGNWQALKDNIDKVLTEVEKGMIRIGDPVMYGGEPKIAMGDNWYNEHPYNNNSYKEFLEYVTGLLMD